MTEQTATSSKSPTRRIILASASPRRRYLLTHTGLAFEVVTADVDEALVAGESPVATARRLAALKARAVASRHPDAFVIGADTVVVDGNTILGKPDDPTEAVAMLRRLRGHPHQVTSAVALAVPGQPDVLVRHRTASVTLRRLADDEIARYVASGDPLDKAGAYAIQNDEFRPVESLAGCFCAVVGFPLGDVIPMLAEAGLVARPAGAACPYGVFTPATCQR